MEIKNIVEGFTNLILRKKKPFSEKRYAKCKVCPHFKKATDTCGKCGCYLPAKTKAKGASCPIGKW